MVEDWLFLSCWGCVRGVGGFGGRCGIAQVAGFGVVVELVHQ